MVLDPFPGSSLATQAPGEMLGPQLRTRLLLSATPETAAPAVTQSSQPWGTGATRCPFWSARRRNGQHLPLRLSLNLLLLHLLPPRWARLQGNPWRLYTAPLPSVLKVTHGSPILHTRSSRKERAQLPISWGHGFFALKPRG